MEFCLAKTENDLHLLSKAVLDNVILACSFLPCCSALLILSVRARARLGRLTQLDLSFVASQPKASGEQGDVARQSVGWNSRKNPGTLQTATASERSLSFCRLGSGSASIVLVSSYVALIAIDYRVLTSCRKYAEIETKF